MAFFVPQDIPNLMFTCSYAFISFSICCNLRIDHFHYATYIHFSMSGLSARDDVDHSSQKTLYSDSAVNPEALKKP